MQTLFNIFLGLHITGGSIALITGIVAMIADKGGRTHRVSGKLYFYGMTAACASSFYLAVAHPNLFLFTVGVFSYQMVAIGYRSLWLKKIHTGKIKPQLVDWAIGLVAGVFNAVLISWGAYEVLNGRMFGIVGLAFGGGGLFNSIRWLKQFYIAPTDKRQWIYSHFQAMGGGYIATATAFLVVNVNFISPLAVWLTPGLIGTLIITITTAKYKRKYAKAKTANVVRHGEQVVEELPTRINVVAESR